MGQIRKKYVACICHLGQTRGCMLGGKLWGGVLTSVVGTYTSKAQFAMHARWTPTREDRASGTHALVGYGGDIHLILGS